MKKLYILLVIITAPLFTVAQDPNLFEHSWFVHSVRDINISNNIMDDVQNTYTELWFEIIFESDKIVLQGCCGGIFEVEISYIGNEEIEIINVTEIQSIACEISFVTNFYQRIKGVFESMIGLTLPYTIQFRGNMHDGALYSIFLSHPNNNSFVEVSNFPNEMSMDSYSPFSNNFDPEVHSWSLVEMHYDGEILELPYGAAKTTFNIYDGSFEVALCGTVEGSMKFSWFWDTTSPEGYCFISCGNLENISDTCEIIAGIDPPYLENFKQNIYDLFQESISPIGDKMYYTVTYYATYIKLVILFLDNQLIFYSNESYLGITENNFSSGITIYPNPTANDLFIHKQQEGIISVGLYTILGQLLLEKEFSNTNNFMSLENLSSGTYFLVVENKEGEKTVKKVVKK